MSQFSQPAAGGGIEWASLNGCLLIIQPTENTDPITTVHGPQTAVRANVIVVDGPIAGTTHEDILVFPRVLKSQLSSRIGQNVLGRLGQGQAKPGQNPPWNLQPGTAADEAAAVKLLTPTVTAADI